MSTNGLNVCEDAEMAECDDEKVVTMMDVLKEQEDFEEDANAVLGASDDKNCTYPKGYVKRQAIYACMTCCADAKNDPTKWAGVCLACSLTCHESHDLIELYTKRNFRCDCGNPKFNSHPCQFTPNKTELNVENIYNQNFSGVYCTCHRPYPDPESSNPEEMIQCIICEDWLHSNHLNAVVPPNEQYSEMICKACMDKNEFLHDYSDLTVNKDNMDVDILNTSSETNTTSDFIDKETAVNEINTNSNNKDTETEITENLAVEKSNETVQTEKLEQTVLKSDSSKERKSTIDDSAIETSENIVTPGTSVDTNLTLNEMSELKKGEKIKTEEITNKQPEEIISSTEETNDNTVEKNTEVQEEATSTASIVTSDTRSQEQVEEDLLLEDSMDNVLDQKDGIAQSNTNQSSTDGSINVKKSGSETTEISISESNIQKTENLDGSEDRSKSDNEKTNEEPENVTTTAESDIVVSTAESMSETTTNELENVNSTDQLVDETPIKTTEDVISTEQSGSGETENTSTTELSENIPDLIQDVDMEPDISESVSTIEQPDQQEKNDNEEKNVLEIKDNNVCEKNKGLEKANDLDVGVDENITDNAVSDEIRKDGVEVDSKCDTEIIGKTTETDINKRKLSSDGDTENVEVKKQKLEEKMCMRPKGVMKVHHGATFWPSNFRQKLCTCNECLSMYKDLSVLFLIDPEDTVTAYERLGEEKTDGKPASQYEKGMAALSSLGRVQQINALTEYAKLRDKLLDFLKTFKDKKVIVKEEDIKAFFAGMKPVREPDGVYFCR